ncbi:MAG TPA: DNRLRE domain-containing protein [Acidobacteriaceae bacterium]|nr:DNRLRE domain-containing protein [Acidobacteriaceae bacterium]
MADAHVNSAMPALNSGAISNLNVGGGYTTLLQFDLSTLPVGTSAANVSRALLRLYANRVDAPGAVSIAPVTAAWGEYSVTYSSQPSAGAAVGSVSVNGAGVFIVVDVTSVVQGWITTPSGNNGLQLASAAAQVQFDSKENDLTAHPAELEIDLVNQGPAGVQGPAGASGAQGPTGPQGTNGSAGAQGPQGVAGAQGPIGLTGPVGLTGPAGATGPAGPSGSPGPIGLTGAAGPAGQQGPQGQTGSTGPAGPQGQQGLTGAIGPTGAQGPAGTIGPQGPAGPQGVSGPQGPAGATGAPGINFVGAWTSLSGYKANDSVTYGGSTYIALSVNSASRPDLYPQIWGMLAQAGSIGPQGATGPAGSAATITIGTVTTGVAGTQAAVTNSGSSSAAVFNFTIPRGADGTSTGGGSSNSSGILFASMYHSVSFANVYYSANNQNASSTEQSPMAALTWVPVACTATALNVYSLQANTIIVTLRWGVPGSMADTGLTCSVNSASSCSVSGSVSIPAGSFVDFSVTGASGTPAGVWTALQCN